jgi:prephenate dehydrogenase
VELRDATVGILGLGLMGGSLGLALEGQCQRRIGADQHIEIAHRAVEQHVIDEALPIEYCASDADIVVLAMPVGQILGVIPQISSFLRDGTIVTDLGSTKIQISAELDELPDHVQPIGGHPMCGSHESGLDAARAGLFSGATWALTPTARTTTEATALVSQLAREVGANPLEMSVVSHDAAVAVVSHLPYVVGQALVATLRGADAELDGLPSLLASTGFASATRTAHGSVPMWRDILLTNREFLRAALDSLRTSLDAIDSALTDEDELGALLARGVSDRKIF